MENLDVFENWLPKKNVPSPARRVSSPSFNAPQSAAEQSLIKDFKNAVEKVLVQDKYTRPNFADNTYSSRSASLAELIESLEYVIEDYKSKL
jgi:hypothetical protein